MDVARLTSSLSLRAALHLNRPSDPSQPLPRRDLTSDRLVSQNLNKNCVLKKVYSQESTIHVL